MKCQRFDRSGRDLLLVPLATVGSMMAAEVLATT
jgi:hypothetical protein